MLAGITHSDADDTDLFLAQIPPDALIILDLSGSMKWTAAGSTMYVSGTDCTIDGPFYPKSGGDHTFACSNLSQTGGPIYGDSSCTGPFYKTSGVGHDTNCSKLAIGKRSLFDLLDDTNDGLITVADETSLGIRLGYMRFYDCGNYTTETGDNYTSGCNTLRREIMEIGSDNYSQLWSFINGESALGGTPLAFALKEGKLYFDWTKSPDNPQRDPARDCRKKFAILITDGEDTVSCTGSGYSNQADDYKRRRETVARAKALADAGYLVFVVGFGADTPHYQKNTLHWAAYHGGTDNPEVPNSIGSSYSIPAGSLYPSGITECAVSSTSSHNLGEGSHYYAASNDPGEMTISGYAFFAEDASQLSKALKTIKRNIQEKSYSFTASAIPIVRVVDRDTVYISSCETPLWYGNLKAYQLNVDGTLPIDPVTKKINVTPLWDAGIQLNGRDPNDRRIYTYSGGLGIEEFKSINSNLTKEALGVPDDTSRGKVISHVRGIDAYDLNENGNTTEAREWKLGDIFHSNPVIVGEPSRFFVDECYNKCSDGSQSFYEQKISRTKVIVVGANDGMLHAFNASTGAEEWAFIPNSLLTNLQSMVSTHTYYVDSSPKVADVWLDINGNNIRSVGEWRTVLVCGLRKGGKTYFALDITDTLNPTYLWEFPKSTDSSTLGKVGQSWSEPAIGRVKIEAGGSLVEKWVAFVGGGFDYTNNVGKAFFVIDISTGDIIKEFYGLDGMNYSFAAPSTAVDVNVDGYVDKVYVGDLGGQMWVFDVSFNPTNNKSNSQWTGKRLFAAPVGLAEKHRVYYQPAVAFDRFRDPWVYFGTGDREYPKDDSNPPERFYAVKDDGKGTDGLGTYPLTETNLLDVTSLNTFSQTSLKGWYITLGKSTGRLEKVLAKPTIFNRLLYFTTYTYTGATNPCTVAGEAKLYVVEYLSGGGALAVDDLSDLAGSPSARSTEIGAGVPSSPTVSVNIRGRASVNIGTTSNQVFSDEIFSPASTKEVIYWREVIP